MSRSHDLTEGALHPQLRPLHRLDRVGLGLLRVVAALTLLLALAGGAIAWWIDPWLGAAMTLLCAVAAAGFGWLHGHLGRLQQERMRIGQLLLTEANPQPALLTFDNAIGLNGFLVLLEEGAKGGRARAALLESGKFNLPPVGRSAVELLFTPNRDGRLLIRSAQRLIFARWLQRPQLRAEGDKVGRLFHLLLGSIGLTFALGAWFLVAEIQQATESLQLAEVSRGWPAAAGVVTRSEVVSFMQGGGKGGPQRYFRAEVAYRYQVQERVWQGERLWFPYQPTRQQAGAEAIVARYPAGTTVAVHYNPSQPSQAVLEVGHEAEAADRRRNHLYGLAALTAAALLVLLLIWLLLLRPNRRRLDQLQRAVTE